MDRMKATILAKDRTFLSDLINCPQRIKRILMRDLISDHHESVKKELTRLRFGAAEKQTTTATTCGDLTAADILEQINRLESDSRVLEEVKAGSVPDWFFKQIDELIANGDEGEVTKY